MRQTDKKTPFISHFARCFRAFQIQSPDAMLCYAMRCDAMLYRNAIPSNSFGWNQYATQKQYVPMLQCTRPP